MEMHPLISLHFHSLLVSFHLIGWFRGSNRSEIILRYLPYLVVVYWGLHHDCKHFCIDIKCPDSNSKYLIVPVQDVIPTRPGWRKKRYPDFDDWLPFDAREAVETATFWAMTDREHRKNEDDAQEQERFRRSDLYVEARTAAQDDGNGCVNMPAECLDKPVGPTAIERFVPEGGLGTLSCLTMANHTAGVEAVEDMMVTETSTTDVPETTEVSSSMDAEGDIGCSCTTIDMRPMSSTFVMCFLLSVLLCLRFGEQNHLVDLISGFSLLVFFYFYRVESILRE